MVRADGHNIPPLLEAVTKLLPLDSYVKSPVMLMDLVPEDKAKGLQTPVWEQYKRIVNEVTNLPRPVVNMIVPFPWLQAEGREVSVEMIERFGFYERAKTAFAVVATGESALYGNIILKKGVLPPE